MFAWSAKCNLNKTHASFMHN